jgi:hypothetical protein
MSIFGSIGHAIKSGVHAIGGVAEKAAPFVGMIPGVGTIAAAGIGGLGALAHGDGLGGALKYGAEGALGDIGANLLGKIPGVAGVVSKIPGVGKFIDLGTGGQLPATPGDIMSALPGGSYNGVLPGVAGTAGTAATQATKGGLGGLVSGVGHWLGGGTSTNAQGQQSGIPNWEKLLGLAGGAAGAVQNAQQSSQARAIQDAQIKQAQEQYARQKSIQDSILANLKGPGPSAPDLSSIFSQTQNPFYKPITPASAAPRM